MSLWKGGKDAAESKSNDIWYVSETMGQLLEGGNRLDWNIRDHQLFRWSDVWFPVVWERGKNTSRERMGSSSEGVIPYMLTTSMCSPMTPFFIFPQFGVHFRNKFCPNLPYIFWNFPNFAHNSTNLGRFFIFPNLGVFLKFFLNLGCNF